MKFLLILLLVLPLSLAAPGEASTELKDSLRTAKERHGKHVENVLKIAKDGHSINNVLRPLSFLSSGGAGFIFKGVRLPDNIPVAIKFINENRKDEATREYEMYSYLNAINKSEVEKYGIPTVYYYGHWEGLVVTAYTELEKTLKDTKSHEYSQCDILLLMKQFIKQSKYIHSHGVRHDDINPENILLRGCESFLIDFDLSSKMTEDNRGATHLYASLKYHQGVKRVATDDWESFLYVICEMAGINFDWFTADLKDGKKLEEKAASKLYAKLKSKREGIFKVIHHSRHSVLIPIIDAFAEEALSDYDPRMPDYDRIYNLVTDALAKNYPTKTCFSWTKQIIDGSIEKANTNISGLEIPHDFSKYESFKYPGVNEQFFKNEESK